MSARSTTGEWMGSSEKTTWQWADPPRTSAPLRGSRPGHTHAALGPDRAVTIVTGEALDHARVDLGPVDAREAQPGREVPCLRGITEPDAAAVAERGEMLGEGIEMHSDLDRIARHDDRALILEEADEAANLAEIGRLAHLAGAVARAGAAMPRKTLHHIIVDGFDRDASGVRPSQEMPRRAARLRQSGRGSRDAVG